MTLPPRLEPWHLVAFAALVAIGLLAWWARMMWRTLKHIEAVGNESKQIALRHRLAFDRFLIDNGYGDNFSKTQVLDQAAVAEGLRKSR